MPKKLGEAARIDGCSKWTIVWRIILPLYKPVLATVARFPFLYAWNDFMGLLLHLTHRQSFTLALARQSDRSPQGSIRWHCLMPANAVTMLPAVLLFFLAQATFIQGIATTGAKGCRRARSGEMQRDCCRELGVVIAPLCRKNHASTRS